MHRMCDILFNGKAYRKLMSPYLVQIVNCPNSKINFVMRWTTVRIMNMLMVGFSEPMGLFSLSSYLQYRRSFWNFWYQGFPNTLRTELRRRNCRQVSSLLILTKAIKSARYWEMIRGKQILITCPKFSYHWRYRGLNTISTKYVPNSVTTQS